MTRTDRRLLLLLAAVTLAWALVDASLGLGAGAAHLAPFLLMLLPLLSGRYVGEERLAHLAGILRRPRRRPASAASQPRAPMLRMPSGGALIARSLAVRPPPAGCAQV